MFIWENRLDLFNFLMVKGPGKLDSLMKVSLLAFSFTTNPNPNLNYNHLSLHEQIYKTRNEIPILLIFLSTPAYDLNATFNTHTSESKEHDAIVIRQVTQGFHEADHSDNRHESTENQKLKASEHKLLSTEAVSCLKFIWDSCCAVTFINLVI